MMSFEGTSDSKCGNIGGSFPKDISQVTVKEKVMSSTHFHRVRTVKDVTDFENVCPKAEKMRKQGGD